MHLHSQRQELSQWRKGRGPDERPWGEEGERGGLHQTGEVELNGERRNIGGETTNYHLTESTWTLLEVDGTIVVGGLWRGSRRDRRSGQLNPQSRGSAVN